MNAMHLLGTALHVTWLGLQGFVYFYPLFMSYLWMMGAALFHFRHERGLPRTDSPPSLQGILPVSVLIPCYNEGPNAEETVRHALALDYPDFEVVAINDGSRDDTGAILDRMAGEANRGVAHASSGGCLQQNLVCVLEGEN